MPTLGLIARASLPWLLACAVSAAPSPGFPSSSNLKADEEVVFFPGLGFPQSNGTWQAEVRGCVYEKESRTAALAALRAALHLKDVQLAADQNALLCERARLFMVDHERRKTVVVRFGERHFTLPRTGANGCFEARLMLRDEEVRQLRAGTDKAIEYSAVLPGGDSRVFNGKVWLVGDTGVVVVSDIDDTLKITGMGNRSTVLRNTFLEPFQAVTGMEHMLSALAAREDCHFCYVSAGPWQLYSPLSAFVQSAGFPQGSFHLREFRWNGKSLRDLSKGPKKHKLVTIAGLLRSFPARRFVLIGDSGELDPEIYGELARSHPGQISAIYIREVAPPRDPARYQSAFRGVPPSVWRTFRAPAEVLSGMEAKPGAS